MKFMPKVRALLVTILVLAICAIVYAQGSAIPHPNGSDTQIQYNNGGVFGGTSYLTLNDSTGVTTATALTVTGNSVLGLNSAVFQPTADSTTFLQVLDADGGSPIFNIDSTNEHVGFGTATPSYLIEVYGVGSNNSGYCDLQVVSTGAVGSGIGLTSTGGRHALVSLNTGKFGIYEGVAGGYPFLFNYTDYETIEVGSNSGVGTGIVLKAAGADNWLLIARSGNDFGIYNGSYFLNIEPTGFTGLSEQSPETLLELTHATPYITLHNSTHEDTDGGRESRFNFKGEQSGGEETTLARIEASHDGAADDQKGKVVISTNDGSDDDTPIEGWRLSRGGVSTVNDPNTLGNGVTTFVVESNVMTITGDGGGNTVATITGAHSGMLLTLIFVDALVTITDTDDGGANTIDLAGTATNLTSADDTVLQLVHDGTLWRESCRSVN